jgi:SAM-dependent methyltransferase
MIEHRQQPLAQSANPNLRISKRFLRRAKNGILRFELIYRLYLLYKHGTRRVSNSPDSPLPNGVLQSRTAWEQATRKGKELRLPLHRSAEKNWDHLGAVHAIASTYPKSASILDAGAEFYSNVLPALFAHGYQHLYGMNLSFADPARRGPIQYLPGDITHTPFRDGFFDAIACMSVIEHGVPLEPYFREMFRLLKPGGLLITSTDYYPEPIDTMNQTAHGAPIKIFSQQEAEQMLDLAKRCGFELTGPIELGCANRPIRWDLYNLEYTFLIFTLRKPSLPS